jgi:hypothetical protein
MALTPAAFRAMADGNLENLAASTPGGIEAQEKAGQQMFVNTDILPAKCPRNELIKLGFKFLGPHDDIFVNVEMPVGWKKVPTDHDMWSHLVDDKGRRRASIFYKAAFYDRSAHMSLDRRFSVGQNYDALDNGQVQYFVKDSDVIVYKTEAIKVSSKYNDEYNGIAKTLLKEVLDWLTSRYPDYENVLAYWDCNPKTCRKFFQRKLVRWWR